MYKHVLQIHFLVVVNIWKFLYGERKIPREEKMEES